MPASVQERSALLAERCPADVKGDEYQKAQKIAYSNTEVPVNSLHPHADLIAAFQRAQAHAAHKFSLIQVVAKKGPRAIQTAIETSGKAAKRRDSYAKKLKVLGVVLED